MKIEVQFFSRLRDLAGGPHAELDLPAGATVGDALEHLYVEYPKLKNWDKTLLLAVGLDFAVREQKLHEGERLSVMPPVQGG